MNPAFRRLLNTVKNTPKDPNAPPRPTLLGQVKELKQTKDEQTRLSLELVILRNRIDYLDSKNRRLETELANLENFIRSRVK